MESLNELKEIYAHFKINEEGEFLFKDFPSFPDYMKRRCAFFMYVSDQTGLLPAGELELVLAADESKSENDFEWGAGYKWLPVSEECRSWMNQHSGLRQMMIMSYLIYGNAEKEIEEWKHVLDPKSFEK